VSDQPNYFVHESSYVDEGARIGEGTMIWHFCHVLGDVRIGKQCRIGQNVVIGPDVEIGNNVKIQNNVSVYRGVTLEDDVFCGPSMVFTNIFTPRSAFPRNRPEDCLPTLVRRGASIGANATIVCGSMIGRHAMIGAGSVVTRDVPAYALVYGNPARRHGWVCECGVVLRFQEDDAVCGECGRRYRRIDGATIERSDLSTQETAAYVVMHSRTRSVHVVRSHAERGNEV
jgi:UDP-2-acetamido-3-amino-2,3-dideoxy-glucuronate N-acetyltransferase